MKHLTLFSDAAEYDAAKYGLDYPNVSVLTASPSTPLYVNEAPTPTPSHEYVEIGGIKWATMNVGATGITDYGLYFQWGDTQGYTAEQVGEGEGQKYFSWEDYKYGSPAGSGSGSGSGEGGFTKYNSTDGLTTLLSEDDAVTANWGGDWRMPTMDEYVTLGNVTNSAWTADYQGSGVAGLILTDKNDSSKVLFFPAAGGCGYGSVGGVVSDGFYWNSSLNTSIVIYGCILDFNSGYVGWENDNDRYFGLPVRGVLVENSSN